MHSAYKHVVGVALLLALMLSSCTRQPAPIPLPQQSGELVVAMRLSPTTVYRDSSGELAGPDYELVSAFAAWQGFRLRCVFFERDRQVLEALDHGQAHMAASGLTVTEAARTVARFGTPYQQRRQVVAVRRDDPRPADRLSELATRRGWIAADAPQLRQLQANGEQRDGRLVVADASGAVDALQQVNDGERDFAVVDSLLLARMRHWLINLEQAFVLPGERPVAWAFPRYGDQALFAAAEEFLRRARTDGTLLSVYDRHFGHLQRLESSDIDQMLEFRLSRLPQYRELFRQAGQISGIDWHWLAALAYQESKWDPQATSYTNVRGIMMLTESTAEQMGVNNRLDPRQSIFAGARYLAGIVESLPASIQLEDRLSMALAGYNLGEGHLRAGRRLAAAMHLDPDTWAGVKRALPELARPDIAARLVSGPARGGEAVILVENVRSYYEVLSAAESSPLTRRSRFEFYRTPPVAADPIIW
ncbi:MAG: membrane-bound lytic murein transglycosylase MltF [Betaproteobacteria bacterium]|jgi:membrane-bound lytic murein transglycosylase F|nr:membrane-bound lytic murein transglycosylase MltF [Betaproteobacteria bacterium]NBY52768.1 membrane-bound lytic murein transglycosylase MltF [Betaproteobacteria bacterium]NCU95290.1 membrane-bound lytic murein transglycosylase MltF [Betaproteobacteria bacterium]NDF70001.1 membrane-bound lytic murein transglycosylase MltF [Betaproteobacteria bacterium]